MGEDIGSMSKKNGARKKRKQGEVLLAKNPEKWIGGD